MSANRRLCAPHRDDVRAIVEDALRPISLGILTRAPGRRFYPAPIPDATLRCLDCPFTTLDIRHMEEHIEAEHPLPPAPKHSPSEVCDCPSTKPPGRPYHCAA